MFEIFKRFFGDNQEPEIKFVHTSNGPVIESWNSAALVEAGLSPDDDPGFIRQKLMDRIHTKMKLASNDPYVELGENDEVLAYNSAYLQEARIKLLDRKVDLSRLTDKEVVQRYHDSKGLDEQEEPFLEVVHSTLDAEGRIKLEMNWNDAFIQQLLDSGIGSPGQEPDDIVRDYLMSLTSNHMRETIEELEQEIGILEETKEAVKPRRRL